MIVHVVFSSLYIRLIYRERVVKQILSNFDENKQKIEKLIKKLS